MYRCMVYDPVTRPSEGGGIPRFRPRVSMLLTSATSAFPIATRNSVEGGVAREIAAAIGGQKRNTKTRMLIAALAVAATDTVFVQQGEGAGNIRLASSTLAQSDLLSSVYGGLTSFSTIIPRHVTLQLHANHSQGINSGR